MIWLIGCQGMLGSEISERLSSRFLVGACTDREIDITDAAALRGFAQGKSIDWIINCAAYTAVDKAEDEVELCTRLNKDGPGNIGAIAAEIGARVIHISTDYVFDGCGTRPYLESDPISPVGVYAATKADGEILLRSACARSFIVRTAWLYGGHGPNFVHTMLRLMKERDRIGVVTDQRGSPTWAADLAEVVLKFVLADSEVFGIYHYTNEGETTWFEFARSIHDEARAAGILTRECRIDPLTTEQYPTRARRPAYSVLSKEKIRRTLALEIPPWQESLKSYLRGEYAR